MDHKATNELTDTFDDVFNQCLERGMQLPFVICAVSRNGSALVTRASGGNETDILAEHTEGMGFTLPINVMVLSQDNRAVRVTIEIDQAKGEVVQTFH
jgi:hypothetical protein